jgi:hypothetical protein
VREFVLKVLRDGFPSDFEDLDALESHFLSHKLVPHVTNKLTNKKISILKRCKIKMNLC